MALLLISILFIAELLIVSVIFCILKGVDNKRLRAEQDKIKADYNAVLKMY